MRFWAILLTEGSSLVKKRKKFDLIAFARKSTDLARPKKGIKWCSDVARKYARCRDVSFLRRVPPPHGHPRWRDRFAADPRWYDWCFCCLYVPARSRTSAQFRSYPGCRDSAGSI